MILFLDTNILLHYPPIKDIDWCKTCGAASVRLVLCLQVIHELDAKKDEPYLAKRTRRAIKEIDGFVDTKAAVRPNVTAEVFNCELRNSDFPSTLSPDSSDDRIVHTVKKFMESTGGTDVAVCSEDTGMRLRCQAHGLRCIKPDESLRQEEAKSELEKKYQAAMAKLSGLEDASPKLDLRVAMLGPNDEPKSKGLVEQIITRPQIEAPDRAMVAEKRKHQVPVTGIDVQDYYRYQSKLDAYIIEYGRWIEEKNKYINMLGDIIRFELEISNSGGSPAEDIEVILELPPMFRILTYHGQKRGGIMSGFPKPPQPPEKPERRSAFRSPFERLVLAKQRSFDTLAMVGLSPPAVSLEGEPGTGVSIRLRIDQLKHFKSDTFGQFTAMFGTKEQTRAFQADLTIMAANCREKIERKVSFVPRT